METLKNYVNWKLAHSDKVADAEGYPLVMENCKANKRMKQLQVYGDCMQRLGSKNLLPYPYSKTTATINGVTFTDNGDGSITVNGTATANAIFYLYTNNTNLIPGIKRGDTVTGTLYSDQEWDASVEKLIVVLNYYNANINMKGGVILKPSTKTRTFTITDDWYGMGFYILVSKGGVVDNITLRVQIELGTTSTEYEPYVVSPSPDCPSKIETVGDLVIDETSEYYGKYKIPITTRGKNLLPYPYHHTTHTRYGITFTDNGDGNITLNGTTTLAEKGFYDFILVSAHKFQTGIYTLSGCPKTGAIYTYRLFVVIKHSDGTVNYVNEIGNNSTFTITDTDLVTINIRVGGQIGTVSNLTFKPQLELGSTATEYEPYVEPITQYIYLDEPLRKVGDYADYIDFKNQKVIRNIKEVTFDGTENWKYNDTDNVIYLSINNLASSVYCYSTHFLSQALKDTISPYFRPVTDILRLYQQNGNILYSSADEFKIFLANQNTARTPLVVYCLLSTLIEEDISCQLPKTLAKTTIISADTSLEPSNIKGKYIIK